MLNNFFYFKGDSSDTIKIIIIKILKTPVELVGVVNIFKSEGWPSFLLLFREAESLALMIINKIIIIAKIMFRL